MSLFYAGAQCGGTLFIFIISIWRGLGSGPIDFRLTA